MRRSPKTYLTHLHYYIQFIKKAPEKAGYDDVRRHLIHLKQ